MSKDLLRSSFAFICYNLVVIGESDHCAKLSPTRPKDFIPGIKIWAGKIMSVLFHNVSSLNQCILILEYAQNIKEEVH